MTLIVEACAHGHFRQRPTAANQSSRQCQALLHDVCVRRESQLTRKAAQQLVTTEARSMAKSASISDAVGSSSILARARQIHAE
jgi:hypothetical protein